MMETIHTRAYVSLLVFQPDEKLIRSILRHRDTMKKYRISFIPSMQDTKDQSKLAIDQFLYSSTIQKETPPQ